MLKLGTKQTHVNKTSFEVYLLEISEIMEGAEPGGEEIAQDFEHPNVLENENPQGLVSLFYSGKTCIIAHTMHRHITRFCWQQVYRCANNNSQQIVSLLDPEVYIR